VEEVIENDNDGVNGYVNGGSKYANDEPKTCV